MDHLKLVLQILSGVILLGGLIFSLFYLGRTDIALRTSSGTRKESSLEVNLERAKWGPWILLFGGILSIISSLF